MSDPKEPGEIGWAADADEPLEDNTKVKPVWEGQPEDDGETHE